MHLRDKVSLHEIAKRTGLSRNMVRSWLRTPEELQAPTYSRTVGFSKLSGFVGELEQSLKADALRPKKDTNAKWAALGKCSADTALRDINDLLARGVLRRLEGGGRSTGHEICAK